MYTVSAKLKLSRDLGYFADFEFHVAAKQFVVVVDIKSLVS